MKRIIGLFAIICLAVTSCDDTADIHNTEALVGFWALETVYMNDVNSAAYIDFLNGGNYLHLKKDKTFTRVYDTGTWVACGNTLKLKRDERTGLGDWTYKILERSNDNLVIEIKRTLEQYCCGSKLFMANELITFKEVYNKVE